MTNRKRRDGSYKVGYKKPPVEHRFLEGRSGNPGGRPPGRKWQPPYEDILGHMVMVREGGVTRQMRGDQAFLQQIARKGMERHSTSTRDALRAIEKARQRRIAAQSRFRPIIELSFVEPGSVSFAAEMLRIGKILNRHKEADAQFKLNPWIVEAAFARFGGRCLTVEEQRTIVQATQTPEKVRWPSWWRVKDW